MKTRNLLIMVVVLLALLGAIYYFENMQANLVGGDRDGHGCIGSAGYSWCEARNECIRVWETYCTATKPKEAVFNCAGGKSIKAAFYIGDDKFANLELSDGRKLSLPRSISASGARYARDDESIVFWNKGDTATVTENGAETYSGCALAE